MESEASTVDSSKESTLVSREASEMCLPPPPSEHYIALSYSSKLSPEKTKIALYLPRSLHLSS